MTERHTGTTEPVDRAGGEMDMQGTSRRP